MSENYVQVARLDEVKPGKMLCVTYGDKRIMLANVEGTVHAVDDMCTHEDASLSTGSLKGHCVKCPLHGSRFDLNTGEPLDDPAYEPIRVYPVKIDGDAICVAIE
ncbi:MAG: non-heme iron oxygenase ferredoxin subunit [Granulosicoccaceae bacterium]|jgi:3-phenylpropionate/trans-cinnamate dioxygenase ferredoxin subunit